MYKVTLSMPIYNVASYVERALLSALNQTFESIEFLLVDDQGTDNSMEIVRQIIKDHPRGKDVRIIGHPYNIGLGATRNTAIDNAQGEYLFFMDSDDEITPDCIQVLYDKMMEDFTDLVVGSYDRINKIGKTFPGKQYEKLKLEGEYVLANYVYVENKPFSITTWNKLYKMSFLRDNKIKCIENHLNEDVVFTQQVVSTAKSCSFISNITLHYYMRENSTEDKRNSNMSYRNADEAIDVICFVNLCSEKYKYSNVYGYYILYGLLLRVSYMFLLIESSNISLIEKKIYTKKISNINFSLLSLLAKSGLKLKYVYCSFFVKMPFFLKYVLYYLIKPIL